MQNCNTWSHVWKSVWRGAQASADEALGLTLDLDRQIDNVRTLSLVAIVVGVIAGDHPHRRLAHGPGIGTPGRRARGHRARTHADVLGRPVSNVSEVLLQLTYLDTDLGQTEMTAQRDDDELFRTIREGKTGTAMPAFGDDLDEEQIWHLINYMRTLAGSAQETPP